MASSLDALPSPKPALLLVDPDPEERRGLARALRQRGYAVDEAGAGEPALALLEQKSHDLLIVDVALPDGAGVDLLLRARLARRDLAIVVLTCHATLDSAIAAIKVDVADYLLKPCRPDDLGLSIARALEERARQLKHQRLLEMIGEAMSGLSQLDLASAAPGSNGHNGRALSVGPLSLDPNKRVLTIKSNPPCAIGLTEGEASILALLMQKPNEVLSYSQLADKALGYQGMDKWTVEGVVRSSVFRLRQKIEAAAGGRPLIRTVRGRGYYLAAEERPRAEAAV